MKEKDYKERYMVAMANKRKTKHQIQKTNKKFKAFDQSTDTGYAVQTINKSDKSDQSTATDNATVVELSINKVEVEEEYLIEKVLEDWIDHEDDDSLTDDLARQVWFASSEEICNRFKLRDLSIEIGREGFRGMGDFIHYICTNIRNRNPKARAGHIYILAKAKWFETPTNINRVRKGKKITVNCLV